MSNQSNTIFSSWGVNKDEAKDLLTRAESGLDAAIQVWDIEGESLTLTIHRDAPNSRTMTVRVMRGSRMEDCATLELWPAVWTDHERSLAAFYNLVEA